MSRHTIFALLFVNESKGKGKKSVTLDVGAGVPQLLSLELAYVGLDYIAFGVGFGSLPVNQVLQSNISLSSISLDLGLSDPYSLVPSASYRFTTTSAFVRLYATRFSKGSNFYLELNYARWKFGSSVSGALRNETSQESVFGAVSGSMNFTQPVLSATVGYRLAISKSIFAQLSVGATYLFDPEYSVSLGGSLASALPLAGDDAETEFENAKGEIDNQIDQGVNDLRATTRVLPALSLAIGVAF